MPASATHSPATAPASDSADLGLSLILRTGVAMCFIGHGAWGLVTKAGWLPYFAVVGIPESWAWQLMPVVGGMDVAVGFLVFLWPCRALFLWAAVWATWTALLRPLAGQGWSEFFERAGNYGVPLALLLAVSFEPRWLQRLPEAMPALADAVRRRVELTLRLTTALLLAGHAGCALLLKKASLAQHFAIFPAAEPAALMTAAGWCELALAGAVLLIRHPAVFAAVLVWKVGTEALFLTSGVAGAGFEFIERGGSYIAPLALILMLLPARASTRYPRLQTA